MTAPNLPPLPDPLEIDWPELHSQALGCGVEYRGIRDRYEAAAYGWESGVDKAIERVPEQIFNAEQMHAYALAAYQAGRDAGLEEAAKLNEQWGAARTPDGGGHALRNAAEAIRSLKSDAKGDI